MRGNSAKERRGPWSAVEWFALAGAALFYLFLEFWLGFALLFSPGWACGWPFGLSFQAVLSGVITGGISVMMWTAAAGAGATTGFACTLAVSDRTVCGNSTARGSGSRPLLSSSSAY